MSRMRRLWIACAAGGLFASISLMTGCAQGHVSGVIPNFDPDRLFVEGLDLPKDLDHGAGSGRGINTGRPRAEGSWHGTLVTRKGDGASDRIIAAVQRYIDDAAPTPSPEFVEYNGTATRLIHYEYGGNKGRVFIALFPNEDETRLRYAVYMVEGRL
jgi:hypothetical protein